MVIFPQLIRGGASLLLLRFLLCSRMEPQKLPRSQELLCFGGCWVMLCLGGHWAVQLTAAAMAAAAFAYFIGQASIGRTLGFTVLFTGLYTAAWACAQAVEEANGALLQMAAFYPLAVCAAFMGKRWHGAAVKLLPLIAPWLVQVLLCAVCIYESQRLGIGMVRLFACLWSLYCSLATLPVSRQVAQVLRVHAEKQQAVRQYAMQEEYYQQLLEKQAETRALWHDLNKYLRAAKAEAAPSQALEQLQAMLDDATSIVDVGNPVVNVILNEYAQSAKAQGIELRLKVQVPERLTVSAADLYILIGNTMDNALEACRALPQSQRMIELTLRTHGDMLFYRLANPYEVLKASPRQDAMRGHGLENARRCVAIYDGQLLTQRDQGFFIVSAHLNLPQHPE